MFRRRFVLVVAMATGCASSTGGPTIEYIAHASFRITSQSGVRVVIDPYGDRVWIGYDYPAGIETDVVLVSHPHYDHDGGISRGQNFPWDTTAVPLHREPGRYEVGDIRITGVRGKHADPYGMEFGQINTIWVLDVDGVRLVHWGDNGPITDEIAAALGQVDVIMLPIDPTYHIISQDAFDEIIARTQTRTVIPMHYALPELEPGELPSDLGPIHGWAANRAGIEYLGQFATTINRNTSDDVRYLIFEPSACALLPAGCSR